MRRFIYILSFIALSLCFAGCSMETINIPITPMHQMYIESVDLTEATMDSITNFGHKFIGYVNNHPESEQDEYFDPTFQNMRAAAALHGYKIELNLVTIGLKIDTDWDGEIIINF